MAKKTVCPISRAGFLSKAPKVTIQINGKEYEAAPKQFSTNSLGWYLNGKIDIEVDGIPVPVQIGMNLTVVGSKELPLDATTHAAQSKPEPEVSAESTDQPANLS